MKPVEDMSPAKPGSSEKAGGIASCYGRGRLPSDLTFLRLSETSTLILSRHGQHLKLDSAKSNIVIVPGDSPSDSVNGVRFSADGYDQLIQCAAEQLNQVRERQLSGLRHAKLSLKSSQMTSAGDKALTQINELAEAEDALASNEFVMGSHHWSLCVHGA